ncbi:MAG TPA: hypothetical protein VG206_26330 [Terriglobia bacterium]|nr:hypothetical protein [Terriglobia bacterium]
MEQTLRFLRNAQPSTPSLMYIKDGGEGHETGFVGTGGPDGLREKLKRRGIGFGVYEPIQNALDEDVTRVDVTLRRPERKRTTLTIAHDSTIV